MNKKPELADDIIVKILGAHSETGTAEQVLLEGEYKTKLIRALDGFDPATQKKTLKTAEQKISALNAIMAERAGDALLKGYADERRSTFSLSSNATALDTEVAEIFRQAAKDLYEQDLKLRFPALVQNAPNNPWLVNFENSREHAVLFSMAYNGGPGLIGRKLMAAITSGNRAEAWFEIRYDSNGGIENRPGIAKRRFMEAQLFGLYRDRNSVTLDEARQTFAMLTKHRPEIMLYESLFGVPTDGSQSQSNMIGKGNFDYRSYGTTIEILTAAADPALKVFLQWINSNLLPAGEVQLLESQITDPLIVRSIDANASSVNINGFVDALRFDNMGNEIAENNLLVGGDGGDILYGANGNDTLFGGGGADTLVGGAGDDTLYGGNSDDVYKIYLGDGIQHDRIVDTQGNNKVLVIDTQGNVQESFILQKDAFALNTWKSKDGSVTVTHNSPWQMTMADGSVIQLGDTSALDEASFSATFGITLLDAPTASVNTFTGDFIKALETNQINYKTSANGYVSAGVLPGAADLIVGTISNDVILGLGGNDALAGGDGADSIDGGDGADAIQGGRGADTLLGGAGDDFIFGSSDGALSRPLVTNFTPRASSGVEIARGFDWVVYNPPGVDANGEDVDIIEGIGDFGPIAESDSNYIDGGAGNDDILAGTANDVAYGGLGDDTVRGMGGSDALYGDDGNDKIEGDGTRLAGYGSTTADAQNGNDALNGGAGNDTLWGQGGDDELFGGIGSDLILGDSHDTTITIHGNDYLDGGDGADELQGGGRDDALFGSAGNDTLFGDGEDSVVAAAYQGNDLLDGGDGDDYMTGEGGSDTLIGGLGADVLKGDDVTTLVASGSHGRDYVDGGDGNDSLYGGGGDDTLMGGAGDDQLVGEDFAAGGSTSSIAANAHGADLIDAGDGNDSLYGQGGADTLLGGAGNDQILGGDGDDFIDGGAGLDIFEGGAGNDYYVFNAGDAPLVGGIAESIYDVSGVDTVELNGFVTGLTQVSANGLNSPDLLFRDGIDQWVLIQGGLTGSIENYILDGTTYSYAGLVGNFSDTSLTAVDGQGHNFTFGGWHGEVLASGNSFSSLSGGAGDDTISAGGGGNTYYYNSGDGSDVITDGGGSVVGGVTQQSSRMVFGADVSLDNVRLDFSGNQLVIYTGDGFGFDSIRLNGFNAANATAALSINSFEFADGTVRTAADLIAIGLDRTGSANSELEGGSSAVDRFSVTAGSDTLAGGAGADSYRFGIGADLDVIDDSDTSTTTVDTLLLDDGITVNDIRLTRSGNDLLVKLGVNDVDILTIKNQFVGNGAGIEQLVFADGTAWLSSTFASRTFTELADAADTNAGTTVADRIDAKAGNDTVSGQGGDDFLFGGGGPDVLNGDAGNDTLDGGSGTDTLNGGAGDDVLLLDSAADSVVGGTGLDTLRAGFTVSLQALADVENVILTGNTGADATGNATANKLIGNASDNLLAGMDGNDTIDGAAGNDMLVGGLGNDVFTANSGVDLIYGGDGADSAIVTTNAVLVGGTGNDAVTVTGSGLNVIAMYNAGDGSDSLSFSVDTASTFVLSLGGITTSDVNIVYNPALGLPPKLSFGTKGDISVNVSGPHPTVLLQFVSSMAITTYDLYALYDDLFAELVANPTMTTWNATAALANHQVLSSTTQAYGGTIAYKYAMAGDISFSTDKATVQYIGTNDFLFAPINISAPINGTINNDFLAGSTGADTLVGFAGNDTLDGGAGADTMIGGSGDDTYVVDSIGDVVEELTNEGTDTVLSALTLTAVANVENITLTGAASTNASGNGLANVLTGNAVDNTLSGDSGQDTLFGAAGNDMLIGGLGNDSLVGGTGDDTYVIDGTGSGQADAIQDIAGNDSLQLSGVNSAGVTISKNADQSIGLLWGTNNSIAVAQGVSTSLGAIQFSDRTMSYGDLVGQRLATTVVSASTQSNGRLYGGKLADTLTISHAGSQVSGGQGNDTINILTGSGTIVSMSTGDGMDAISAVRRDAAPGGGAPAPRNVLKLDLSDTAAALKLYQIEANTFALTYNSDGDGIRFQAPTAPNGSVAAADWPFDAVVVGNSSEISWATILAGGITNVIPAPATSGNDVATLSPLDDIYNAGSGNDSIFGSYGNDTLIGGTGNDYLEGGFGGDSYTLTITSDHDSILEEAQDKTSIDTAFIDPAIANSKVVIIADPSNYSDLWVLDNEIPGQPVVNYFTISGFFDTVDYSGSIDRFVLGDGAVKTAEQIWNANFPVQTQTSSSGNIGAGRFGDDTINGWAGYDLLLGFAGNDVLNGGGGGDLIYAHSGSDTIVGGAGSDTINGGSGDNLYVFQRGDGTDTIAVRQMWDGGGSETVRFGVGIAISDVAISWDDSYDLIYEDRSMAVGNGSRNFRISIGSSGDSLLINSALLQSDSTTSLKVEFSDASTLLPNDIIASLSTYVGTGLNDVLVGSVLDDRIIGGKGDDNLLGLGGNDEYYFEIGDGRDIVTDDDGFDSIVFGVGISPSQVVVQRHESGELSVYYSDIDSIFLSAVGASASCVENVLFADGTSWMAADLTAKAGFGSPNDDNIVGTDGADTISGLSGNDFIYAQAGADTITGGVGNDFIDGGAGSDVYVFSPGFGHDRVLDYSEGITVGNRLAINGISSQNIILSRDDTSLYVISTGTNDSVEIFDWFQVASNFSIQFDNGSVWDGASLQGHLNTTVVSDWGDVWYGSAQNDVVNMLGGDDVATGANGDDGLIGGAGNDTILGGAGNDTLDGGAGDDDIVGDSGNDILRGGSGDDYFADSDGVDLIQGDGGNDVIEAFGSNIWLGGIGVDYADVGGITTNDLVLFNAGDGDDVLYLEGSVGSATVISIGGVALADISITPGPWYSDGVVLNFGINDSIEVTFAQSTDSLVRLQVIGANSVQTYDLLAVVADFEAARLLNPSLTAWAAASSLSSHRLTSGSAQAYGGEIAYRYAIDGNLLALSDGTISQRLAQPGYLSSLQSLPVPPILGTAGNDSLTGSASGDLIRGFSGDDTLNGLGGPDTLEGGSGNDVFIVDVAADVIVEVVNEGTDSVQASVSYVLGGNIENLLLTGASSLNGTGNTLDNVLIGNSGANTLTGMAGNDTLDGGAGNDTMVGGAGNDTYVMNVSTDVVTEVAGEGTDTIQASFTLTLAVNFENLTLTGSTALGGTGNTADNVLIGNSAANTLTGQAGNDTLNGGLGNDTLVGGAGNDTYVVNVSTVVVTELASEGTDTVQSSVTLTLSNNVENLVLIGAGVINGTGNTLANNLTGNSANNALNGGAGIDTMAGGAGNDSYTVDNTADMIIELASEGTDAVSSAVTYTLAANVENLTLSGTTGLAGTGNTSDNLLTGNGGANTLTGLAGNDTLNGGTGIDTLIGGAGNDTYVVDVVTDVVTELVGEGTDTIQAGVTLILSANTENLTLTGTSGLSGTGNTSDNVLTGNSGANTLTGLAGNDTLDGGTGNDTMVGGAGNDTYVMNVSTDVVTELAGEGTDTIQAAFTMTLATNFENLTLTGSTALNGTGNTLDNVLTGNSGANTLTGLAGNDTLDGGTGNDTLVGGAGNDIYVVDVSTDVVTELANEGTDTLRSAVTLTLGTNVENLTLTGSAALSGTGNTLNNALTGNTGANTLAGLTGNDTLDGGVGNDILIGAAGADTYLFGAGWGTDTIQDSVATINVKDVVMLQGTLTQADVQFSQVANNLQMLIAATGDKLIVQDWYLGSQFHVEEFRFSDGSIVTDTQAQGLVGALATFGANAPSLSSNSPGPRMTIGVIDLAVSR